MTMPTRRSWIAGAAASLAACSWPLAGESRSSATLAAYRSEGEFDAAVARWRAAAETRRREQRASLALQAAPAAAPPSPAMESAAKVSADAAGQTSITNVQTAGVDEGGIVKRAGDFLLVLRRGRLFTVRVGGDSLQPASMVDAWAPGSDPQGAWYDELLVSGRTVVVVGYSYARGGTEIGLFDLAPDGTLAHRATHHLRSFDYYSARNYASRLIGNRLVFYAPTLLQPWGPPPVQMMPAWRRWQPGALPGDFRRILPATRIYRTDDDFAPGEPLALHTVTVCELDGSAELRCESTAVLGPAGRVFYVAADAVYVWTASWRRAGAATSAVFRLPLSGAAPTGLKAAGVPTDQMSFLEADGHLHVLLRAEGRGEGMWGSSGDSGDLALLRVPLVEFGDGRGAARAEHYRRLPGADHALQNRYVGDWLLWGGRRGGWAVRWSGGGDAQALDCGHAIERIEALGRDALVAGNAGSELHLTAVRLQRGAATPAGRHVERGARQGETRTHGFFYRALDGDEGLLGLPVVDAGRRPRDGGVYGGTQGAAAVLFLRQRDLAFSALGELRAGAHGSGDDGCRASCVDWYGNARPIFLGERVFALLGYELVEGRLDGRRLEERRRISFAPRGRDGGRYTPFGG
jgi:hypothetical protein